MLEYNYAISSSCAYTAVTFFLFFVQGLVGTCTFCLFGKSFSKMCVKFAVNVYVQIHVYKLYVYVCVCVCVCVCVYFCPSVSRPAVC